MLTIQRLDQLPCLRRGEARQVYHRIRTQVGDDGPEPAVLLGGLPVTGHHLDVPPRRVLAICLTRSPADDDSVVAGSDQARHQVCADVACPADDHYPHAGTLMRSYCLQGPRSADMGEPLIP